MKVEVIVPDEFIGDMMGQLNARRGEIQGMDSAQATPRPSRAMVPLAKCLVMPPIALSHPGTRRFTMELDHYSQVPENVAKTILASIHKSANNIACFYLH